MTTVRRDPPRLTGTKDSFLRPDPKAHGAFDDQAQLLIVVSMLRQLSTRTDLYDRHRQTVAMNRPSEITVGQ